MTWTLHLQPIRNPWADDALLAAGRALYIAQAFEDKCRSLLRFGYLIDGLSADPVARLEELIAAVPKDRQLKPTLDELIRIFPEAREHGEVLSRARQARNYIAHEGVLFSIHDERAAGLGKRLSELQRQVHLLASGDNLVSAWSFQLHERKQPMPVWLVESYCSMIDEWVFEPVRAHMRHPDSSDS
jgi:hypothetical protein